MRTAISDWIFGLTYLRFKSVMELLDSLLLCEIEACVDRVDLALRGSSPFTRSIIFLFILPSDT